MLPEAHQATVTGNMRRKLNEVPTYGVLRYARWQTNRQTDTHHNTLQPFWWLRHHAKFNANQQQQNKTGTVRKQETDQPKLQLCAVTSAALCFLYLTQNILIPVLDTISTQWIKNVPTECEHWSQNWPVEAVISLLVVHLCQLQPTYSNAPSTHISTEQWRHSTVIYQASLLYAMQNQNTLTTFTYIIIIITQNLQQKTSV